MSVSESGLIRLIGLLAAALLGFASICGGATTPTAVLTPAPIHVPTPGLDLASMDPSVQPGDDFYRFVNGNWLRNVLIPADRSSWGVSAELAERNRERTAELIRQIAADGVSHDPERQKIRDYYASFMDAAAIEARGFEPVRPALSQIAAIRDRKALARWLGAGVRADVDVLNATNLYTDNILGLWVAQDLDNPTRYLPFFLQGGLELPDRDYYLSATQPMREIRRQYRRHIESVFRLAHFRGAAALAARVMALETRIAAAHGTRTDAEDVAKGDNHWSRANFVERAPGLDWNVFLAAAGLDSQAEFVVWQPSALQGIAVLVDAGGKRGASLEDWRAYLSFHALEHFANYLPRAMSVEHFRFYGTVLEGTPQQPLRWKRAVDHTSAALGDAVGKLYVARYFPPAAKAKVVGLVAALLKAFAQRIEHLDWMAPATKAQALLKLAALKVGVGYPDSWRDYSALRIVRGEAYGNADRAERFELARNLAKLGQPVDRSEWVMTAQTVNAVNLPAMNALNFPAGILQPPLFDPDNPAALNFGNTGATIGHEISHSFDDQGAQFDAAGRFRNWWTAADLALFRAAGEKLARQFDAYRPFPDVAVNGHQTLSENIADVAGLAAAYDAYHLSETGQEASENHGYSGDQQFFIGFGEGWRSKTRDPALRQQLVTDGHAPDEYRATTVRNIEGWYRAFKVLVGQKLYLTPAERVPIW